MLKDLQLGEFIYEQPAFPDPEYIFKHALTQEVAYNSILIERRRLLHERTAESIEAMFPQQLDEHLSELAHHYGRSGNAHKAIEYLARSAQQAKQRSAHQEAIASLRRALELSRKLPDEAERARHEMRLQSELSGCIAAVRGPSSPQARAEMERTLSLAERLQDKDGIFRAISALHPSYVITMELQRARELSNRSLAMSEEANDPVMIAGSHGELGNILICQGRFLEAEGHLKQAMASGDVRSPWNGITFPTPLAHSLAGWNAWFLGYPDQARRLAEQSMAAAKSQTTEHLVSSCTMWNMRILICLRDFSSLEGAGEFAAATAERGFGGLARLAQFFHGWSLSVGGDPARGIPIIEGVWEDLLRLSRGPTSMHILYADAYRAIGRYEDGLRHVDDSLRLSDETGERTARAELYRLKGELLLAQDSANAAMAEREIRTAINVAREQSAKSWELRASTSLARLLRDTNRRDEARAMLAEIYNWFTEGFDTPDLMEAKALLDQLSAA